MLKSPYIFAVNVLLALLAWTGTAKAQLADMGLSFELPPAKTPALPALVERSQPIASLPVASEPADSVSTEAASKMAEDEVAIASLTYKPEPLPPITAPETAPSVETNPTEEVVVSNTSEHGLDAIALTFSADTVSVDTLLDSNEQAAAETQLEETRPEEARPEPAPQAETPSPSAAVTESPTTESTTTESLEPVSFDSHSLEDWNLDDWSLDDWIFENGSNSLVARTVGSAEGTRYSDGERTRAYYGHVDPGNGVWNLGTFSYQHGANSPEEADRKQLQRLKKQGLQLMTQANEHGLSLSLEEKLNGLALANQAPLAALDKGGYIARLAQARRLQMEGIEAILWARTYAYIDPDTRRWNAPGLGNNVHSISRDQERRMSAISQAMKAYDPGVMTRSTDTAAAAPDMAKAGPTDNATENAAASARYEVTFASGLTVTAAQPSHLSDMEVSFDLPASGSTPTVSSTLAAAIEARPASQSERSETDNLAAERLTASDVEESGTAASSEQPAEQATAVAFESNATALELATEADSLAIAFMPTENISEPQASTRPVETATEQSTPSTADDSLFPLNVEPAEDQATVAASSSQDESSEQLQRLLRGVKAEQLTSEERANLLEQIDQNPENTEQDVSFWRTEDKIIQEKQ